MYYSCLILLLVLNTCCASQRMLKSFLNPGCDELCTVENVTTVYLRAEGTSDTLHYLWDFVGNPSLLLAITSPSAQLYINWDNYLSNTPHSINFTEKPKYTFGISIQKFIEFNDINDTGLLDTSSKTNINILNTQLFKWLRKGVINDTKFVELQMDGSDYHDSITNKMRHGNVQIMLNGFCTLEHSDVMPHMLHSENSTQIDIIFNNLETNSSFSSSRLAMELLLVSESTPNNGMFIDAKKSLDDEHTPGIFEVFDTIGKNYFIHKVVELRTPYVEQNGAYLQWRPVSYTASSRAVGDATETVYYPLVNITNPSDIAVGSLLYAYYGEQMDNLLVEKINISLGMKGDGFYKQSNYTTWTFIVGYGVPPAEQFSYLVIMIMSIGLGLPVLMMIAVGIYFCVRRIPKRHENAFINS